MVKQKQAVMEDRASRKREEHAEDHPTAKASFLIIFFCLHHVWFYMISIRDPYS